MATYDKEQVQATLAARAEELARRREQVDVAADGMREGELSGYDQHPADTGTEMHEQELDETTSMLLADEQRQVAEAQRALEDGTYGVCVDCGEDIPPVRLDAIPEATRCVEDQRRFEGRLRAAGPPPQDI